MDPNLTLAGRTALLSKIDNMQPTKGKLIVPLGSALGSSRIDKHGQGLIMIVRVTQDDFSPTWSVEYMDDSGNVCTDKFHVGKNFIDFLCRDGAVVAGYIHWQLL